MSKILFSLLPATMWLLVPATALASSALTFMQNGDTFTFKTRAYQVVIEGKGFRYELRDGTGAVLAAAHPEAGLLFGSTADVDLTQPAPDLADMTEGRVFPVVETKLESQNGEGALFSVVNSRGDRASVRLDFLPHRLRMAVRPEAEGVYGIVARTAGVSPAFGLADHGGIGRESDELTGFASDYMGARTAPWVDHPEGRLISNFVIFPRQGLAAVNVEANKKVVRLTASENAHGAPAVREMPAFYYFFGEPREIYRQLREVREVEGFPFFPPKYELFGLGWEAFGALGWTTNAKTVEANINTYLELGYPLSWMVIGSGFWPAGSKELWGTTSFGMWDPKKYPEPREFLQRLKDRGLTILLGLRIAFKEGNPFGLEAAERGFLITDAEGKPQNFADRGHPTHLLDFENPEAVTWYVEKCRIWLDYGVDGFKEDLMFLLPKLERDDKVDPVNRALMEQGVHIMGRNMYFGSPVDLHRFNDFNFYETQDRGPINGLALAYAGFPYVYPDIVGGTSVWKNRETDGDEKVAQYLMRYAQYASVHPAMAFGYGPWSLGRKDVIDVTREAGLLHDRLHPYIYSYAVQAAETGFPYTFTPLPLAYPQDPGVYELANVKRRSYQWLLGESLLATPLYGDDYATAQTRDVYLPEGRWIEYDSGEVHEGPKTLKNYPLPVGRTPLFVGGPGIVVEQEWGRLLARIYPVRAEAAMTFTDRSGEKSTISIDVPSWEDDLVQITETGTGAVVRAERRRGALEFVLEPGRDYAVRSIPMPPPVVLKADDDDGVARPD